MKSRRSPLRAFCLTEGHNKKADDRMRRALPKLRARRIRTGRKRRPHGVAVNRSFDNDLRARRLAAITGHALDDRAETALDDAGVVEELVQRGKKDERAGKRDHDSVIQSSSQRFY